MRTFHPDKKVRANPHHGSNVIYADDTCIRVVTAEMIGGGGGFEIMGAALLWVGLGILLMTYLAGATIVDSSVYYWHFGVSFSLIILPIILFRTRPNYLIFSRKSQEIYYVKSNRKIYRLQWKAITGRYAKVAVFTGGGAVRNDYLRIAGISNYPDGTETAVSIAFQVLDEEAAKALWAYFQAYMEHGTEGLPEPAIDWVSGDFLTVTWRMTKWWLYSFPKSLISTIFQPKLFARKYMYILYILALPIFLTIHLVFITPIMWFGGIATAFVNSTRTRAQLPDDIKQYTTDNKQSYGTKQYYVGGTSDVEGDSD